MADGKITPPPGFVLEESGQSPSSGITPPPGFVPEGTTNTVPIPADAYIGAPGTVPIPPGAQIGGQGQGLTPGELLSTGASIGVPGVIQGGSMVAGAVKGAGETAHTIGRIINAVTGDRVNWLPTSLDQPKALESSNAGETAGKIGESIAEFALGDEALKGLSIMEKLGVAQKITALAEKSPILAKLIRGGIAVSRGSAAGAVSGGLHGGAEGAEAGAVGGAAGEVIGAGLGQLGKLAQIPSKVDAGKLLGEVNDAIGDHPVIADHASQVAMEIIDKAEEVNAKTGGLKKTLQKFLERVTDPEQPLTFAQAREFEQVIGGMSPSQRMKLSAPIKPMLREFNQSLRSAIEETADNAGPEWGAKFRQGMRGYRVSSTAEQVKEHLTEHAVKYAVGSAGTGAAGLAYGVYKSAQ